MTHEDDVQTQASNEDDAFFCHHTIGEPLCYNWFRVFSGNDKDGTETSLADDDDDDDDDSDDDDDDDDSFADNASAYTKSSTYGYAASHETESASAQGDTDQPMSQSIQS